MVSAFDVAVYILQKTFATAMKLQKLIYYCQAWSLVWDEQPLFRENIEAWANGPVVRELYEAHRGRFNVSPKDFPQGNADNLSPTQKETIDAVLEFYGNKSSQWLSDLTHMEAPWKNARKGISDSDRSNQVIGLDALAEYYSSLPSES